MYLHYFLSLSVSPFLEIFFCAECRTWQMAPAVQSEGGSVVAFHISHMQFMYSYVQKLLCINRTHLANLRAESKYLIFEYLVRLNCNCIKIANAHKSQYLDIVSAASAGQWKWGIFW